MGILAGPAMGNASLWVWVMICVCAVNVSPQIIDMDTNTEGLSDDAVELRPSKQIFPRQTAGSNSWTISHPRGAQPFSRLRRASKCLFNSLAYNCDFQDAIGAAQEASYWGSGSPGRRKRKYSKL